MNTIKAFVLNYVHERQGVVDFDDLTAQILEQFPDSKWDLSHWRWYRSHIITGRFKDEFSEVERQNVKASRVVSNGGQVARRADITSGSKGTPRDDVKQGTPIRLNTIKAYVFSYIHERQGKVDFADLTAQILEHFPNSKWKPNHWVYYRSHIVRGMYGNEFSELERQNVSASPVSNNGEHGAEHSGTAVTRRMAKHSKRYRLFQNKCEEVEREIAIMLAKVSYHVHPSIVEKIAAANAEFKTEFIRIAPPGINPEDFLYSGSACVFPGVRRHISRQGGQTKRNCYRPEDDAIIDDNVFPRHLWIFLHTGGCYNPHAWKSTGMCEFELAHIFAHKPNERRLEQHVFEQVDEGCKPYGLFTCAANVTLIPRGLAKPTDGLKAVRLAFFKRHIELYGESTLPGLKGFKEEALPTWYEDLREYWMDPILPEAWEEKVENLLRYRTSVLKRIFESGVREMPS